MKFKFLLILLIFTALSGCVGVTFSRNSDAITSNAIVTPDPIFGRKSSKPASSKHEDGSETYIVLDERVWCGLTVFAVIPIPLWLPVCRNYNEVTYKDNLIVSSTKQNTTLGGFLCGPLIRILGAPQGFCSSIK